MSISTLKMHIIQALEVRNLVHLVLGHTGDWYHIRAGCPMVIFVLCNIPICRKSMIALQNSQLSLFYHSFLLTTPVLKMLHFCVTKYNSYKCHHIAVTLVCKILSCFCIVLCTLLLFVCSHLFPESSLFISTTYM